jgi:hypothetical protein
MINSKCNTNSNIHIREYESRMVLLESPTRSFVKQQRFSLRIVRDIVSKMQTYLYSKQLIPSDHTRPWGSLNLWQKWVREIEIKIFLWSRARPVFEANNLAAVCEPAV